jgi:hypothetical protein
MKDGIRIIFRERLMPSSEPILPELEDPDLRLLLTGRARTTDG